MNHTNQILGGIRTQFLEVGPLMENCHLLWREHGREAVLFDPGAEGERIIEALESLGLQPVAFLQTHCHGDHIGGLNVLKERFSAVPLHVHAAEEAWLAHSRFNLSYFTSGPVTGPKPDVLLAGDEDLAFAGLTIRAIHIPGHSPGGTAYFVEDPKGGAPHVFVGDILFAGSIGRTDFPGSAGARALIQGIREKLFVWSDETIVHPGHGPDTTIGKEKKGNPFCGVHAPPM